MSAEVVLPEEIITLILKSISDPPTAARCLQVCSRWRSAIDRASYWRELYYESIVPKNFERPGDLPSDHRLNTPFWKKRVALTYSIQQSIKKQKCLPRIIASTVIDSKRNYFHPRVQSFNKTHCAITWEIERPLSMSTDNEYVSELMGIGSTSPSLGISDYSVIFHGNYALFCNVTPYRTADLSEIKIVKFNPSTFHIDFTEKRFPDPLPIPNACKLAKHTDPYSKYLVVASYEDDRNVTVNVVDLDARQIIFSERYKGRYSTLVAHGNKFALLTNLGTIVTDFTSKKRLFSSKVNGTDAVLFEDTLYIIEKQVVKQIEFSEENRGGKRSQYNVNTEGRSASKIFMYQGLFVLAVDYALYFYTPNTFEQVAKFTLPQTDVADVVTIGNGNMVITFEDDGTIFNVSFNPRDTEQLVQLDLVELDGTVKSHECVGADLLESFRQVNQQDERMHGVTSLYFDDIGQKRYGMLLSVIPTDIHEDSPPTNHIAEKLLQNSRLDIRPPYKTPFRNVGFASFQSVRHYGINVPKNFPKTIGIFCEEKIDGEWMFVKPVTSEWQGLINNNQDSKL